MRALRFLVAILLIPGLAGAAWADQHQKAEALEEEVARFGDELTKAMLARDFDRMLSMYAKDAISLPNYGPRMQGLDQFRKHQEMMESSGMKVLSFESEPTEVWQAGDQVIEIGRFQITLEMPPMPDKIEDHGKYVTIYERNEKGALKIKVETWNTDVNPMAMGMMDGQEGEPAPTPSDDREEPVDLDRVP